MRGDTSRVVGDFNRAKGPVVGAMRSIGAAAGRAMSQAMALAGVAGFGTLFFMAGQEAVTFEKAMIDVRANARLLGKEGETAFQKLVDLARELGAATQFTAVQAAQALNQMVLGGLSAEEAIGAVPHVLNLAASANLELAESATIVVNNMRKYGMEATDTARIADYLSSAQSRAQITAGQLAAGLQSLGSISAAMNVSFRDTVAILTGMGRSGTEMSRAGAALAMALARLSRQPAEVKDVLEEMNVEMQKFVMPGGGVDLIGVFRAIADALPTDPIRRGAKAMELFGARGREILGVLNLMAKGRFVEETAKGLDEDLGRAAKVAAAKMSVFWGTLKKVRSALGELFIAGLTPVLRIIEPFVLRIRDMAVWTSVAATRMFDLFQTVRESPFGEFLGRWVKLISLSMSAVSVLSSVKIALGILNVAFITLMGPMGGAIGLLTAIGAAFVYAVGEGETFGDRMQDVFENKIPSYIDTAKFALRNLGPVAELAATNISLAFAKMHPKIESIMQEVGALFYATWEVSGDWFNAFLETMRTGLLELKNLVVAFAEGMEAAWKAMLAGDIANLPEKMWTGFMEEFISQPDVKERFPVDIAEKFKKEYAAAMEGFMMPETGLVEKLEAQREKLLGRIAQDEVSRAKDMAKAVDRAIRQQVDVETVITPPGAEKIGEGFGRVGFAEFGKQIQDAILQKKDPVLGEAKNQTKIQTKINNELVKLNAKQPQLGFLV